MSLPSPHEAASWFVVEARAAIRAGERLDPAAIQLFIDLAPDDPLIAGAIENVDSHDPTRDSAIVAEARATSEALRRAVLVHDEGLARASVTRFEEHVLRVYRPGRGLGSFEDNVAAACAMLDAFDVGGDSTHLMMAEELLLVVLRLDWPGRGAAPLWVSCDAAVAFRRLAERTGNDEYGRHAVDALQSLAVTYRRHGWRAAPYVSALRAIG